jgi:1-acyl-sn-glycerol-3-phosphate acyltransferase
MTLLGKVLISLLANVEINGKERLPKQGPIILAGNHVAVLEAVMMAVYNPGLVEFLGTGDIPFDPNYAGIVKGYEVIPVNRGNLDRKSLNLALEILDQNGILGIFPEGGTWDPSQMEAQTGVAWLSYKSQAPILPIGFGGVKGGLQKALKLQRPNLIMNVGDLIPPVQLDAEDLSMKDNLQQAANLVLTKINELIPEKDKFRFQRRVDEEFELEIKVLNADGVVIEPEQFIQHGSAYARLLYNPTLLDVLYRNLNLPIKPLKFVYKTRGLVTVQEAWQSILAYLEVNPGFFTYRFGVDEGIAVKESLVELLDVAKKADFAGHALTITPIRRYRNENTGAQVIERGGCFPESM